MLHALAKHAGWSLRVRTKGDLASMLISLTASETSSFNPAMENGILDLANSASLSS